MATDSGDSWLQEPINVALVVLIASIVAHLWGAQVANDVWTRECATSCDPAFADREQAHFHRRVCTADPNKAAQILGE